MVSTLQQSATTHVAPTQSPSSDEAKALRKAVIRNLKVAVANQLTKNPVILQEATNYLRADDWRLSDLCDAQISSELHDLSAHTVKSCRQEAMAIGAFLEDLAASRPNKVIAPGTIAVLRYDGDCELGIVYCYDGERPRLEAVTMELNGSKVDLTVISCNTAIYEALKGKQEGTILLRNGSAVEIISIA